jgi:hypothetical protein
MILGKNDDLTMDEFGSSTMDSICPITTNPITKLNFPQFLANQIHYHLSEIKSLQSFRYQSYLVDLSLFS